MISITCLSFIVKESFTDSPTFSSALMRAPLPVAAHRLKNKISWNTTPSMRRLALTQCARRKAAFYV